MDFAQTVAHPFHSAAHSVAGRLDRIVVWGVRVLVALLPLFFLPWTFDPFEFNKQFLLIGGAVVLLALWVTTAVIRREVKIAKSPLNWVVLAWLVIVVAATVFSVDWITSVLGFYGRFNGGLVSVVGYAVLYFLVMQTVRLEHNSQGLVVAWLIGVGVSGLVSLLQLLGVHTLPIALAQATSFTPLGRSLNAEGILLGTSVPLALWYARQAGKGVWRALSLVSVIVSLAVIFLVDYQLGWVSLLVASVVWLGLVFWKNESVGFQWTIIPSLAILLTVLGWPLSTTRLTGVQVPVEVNLSLPASWTIAAQAIKSNPVLGTGPETFIYGFSKYKPANLNDSDFWAFRFDKSASELSQVFATTGFLGLAGFVAVLLLALYMSWRVLRDRGASDWYLRAAVVSSLLVLVAASALYFSNTAMAVTFWLLVGLVAGFGSKGERHFSLTGSPRLSFLFSFGLAVVVLLAVGVWFGIGRFWAADYAYARGQAESQNLTTLDNAAVDIASAANLNPWRDSYRISLAQVYLALANRQANTPAGKTDAERRSQLQVLQQYISSSIAAARSATDLARENVANWEALGSIYRGTVLFTRDAEDWVIGSFQQAIKLEPSNPALYTELGKAYLVSASRKRQEASTTTDAASKAKLESAADSQITQALQQFDQAIKLKPQYTPAHFNEALAFELQGKIDDAIAKLESIRSYNQTDIDVLYELGSLYYGKARYDDAGVAFTTITNLVPNHVNAWYGLSLVYQKKNDFDKAVAAMQKVLDLNPDNATVQQQLDALKKQQAQSPAAPANQPSAPATQPKR